MKCASVGCWFIAIPLFVLLIPQTVKQGTTIIPPTNHDVPPPMDGKTPPAIVNRPVVITPVPFPDVRYRLIEHFPRIFMCGPLGVPFYYGDVQADAIGAFPDIMKDASAFQAMAKHLRLEKVTEFSDVQKMLLYQEYLRLQQIMTLEADGDHVKFSLRYLEDPHKRLVKPPNTGVKVSGYVEPSGEIKVVESFATSLQCPK